MKEITHLNETNGGQRGQFDRVPSTCPICHKGIDVRIHSGFSDQSWAEVVFQCPREECRKTFIGYYVLNRSNNVFEYYSVKPIVPETKEHSEEIKNVSEVFCHIYDEADKAEQLGLTQVCGAGYRKAVEFLIKDYVIRDLPSDEKEEVKNKFLGNVIKENVKNENIKNTAEKATWLGNDETHYTRKWEHMDIEDLKNLIGLTVRWIESEEMTKAYLAKMSSAT